MSKPHPWLVALSDAALLALAGPTVFARGQVYAQSGAIQDPAIPPLEPGEKIALDAVVQGTQPYNTRVWIDAGDGTVAGDCDCPHAGDGYFCKHQVAMALILRGILGGNEPETDPVAAKKVAAAAKRAQTQAKNREALRRFLGEQNAGALADRLWQWAEGDRHRMAELKSWYTQTTAGQDTKALKSAISDLLRDHSGFLDWRDSDAYAHRARQVLPMLAPWLQHDPSQLRELCEHALLRVFKVAECSDDSNGEIGDVLNSLHDLLLDALRASPPPAAWLDRWFALMDADPWGLWAEADVLAAAGPAVQARYAERAAKDWHQWLANHAPSATVPGRRPAATSLTGPGRVDHERRRLRRRYLDSLQWQGDVQAVIDVMCGHLADASEHSELIRYCETHGRERDAMRYAQAALKLYPNDWRLEEDMLRAYERDGWDEDALVLRRKQLETQPDVDHFLAVLDAAERAGRNRSAYREELMAWAQKQEQSSRPMPGFSYVRFQGARGVTSLPNVSTRVAWLLADRYGDEALALARTPGTYCTPLLLRELATRLPVDRHAEAVPLLLRVFELAMQQAKSPYREPLALVREVVTRMPTDQGSAWLFALRAQHKAKRNFIAGLPG